MSLPEPPPTATSERPWTPPGERDAGAAAVGSTPFEIDLVPLAPFTSPVVAGPFAADSANLPAYRPVARLATWVQTLLVASGLACAVDLLAEIRELDVASDVHGHGTVPAQRIADADTLLAIAARTRLLLLVVTGVVFIIWFHRVHKNLRAMQTPALENTDALAAASFIVPFAGLVLPWRIAIESWRASDPGRPPLATDWKDRPVGSSVHTWWTLFVLMNLTGVAAALFGPAHGYGDFHALHLTFALSAIIGLPAAASAVVFVRQLSARHRQRATRMARFQWLPEQFASGKAT